MEIILKPWPWYVSGPLIAIIMFLLIFAGKKFGISSNMRTLCSIAGAGKFSTFFKYDWRSESWNLMVVLGAILGGFLAANYLVEPNFQVNLNPEVVNQLDSYGFSEAGKDFLPAELFSWKNLDPKNIVLLLAGGFLIGFGSRYAGGCTSGHGISGLSNFQLPSLVAVIGFFIGGLIMVHLVFPLIF
ncbi:MAG TPA: YeeE/YedE thiosulfate transporter family protein [Mangrovimonas sp.]|nr:YeeE/YedE thiosulfate transporter family protein [Mangrovimonas sp.]